MTKERRRPATIGEVVRHASEMGLAVTSSEGAGSMHYSGQAISLLDWDKLDEETRWSLGVWLTRAWPGWPGIITSGYRQPIFDWKKVCPNDLDPRVFPAVVGPGRGVPLSSVRPQR